MKVACWKCKKSKGRGFLCGGCGRYFCPHLCGAKHEHNGTLYATCTKCKIAGKGWSHEPLTVS